MKTRRLVAAGLAAATALGSATALAGPGLPPTGATPVRVDVPVRLSTYPVYDAKGHRAGSATWRISAAGGNCCETYVTGTPSGRIVESGGTYPWYTDDGGKHWYEVKFDVPDQNDNGPAVAGGEGATVVGPGGDVYGVTWDAYSGDHLQAYRYTAQNDSWNVAEVTLKTPVYDRPWLSYAQGSFVLDGAKTRQLLAVTGGTLTKSIDTLSADGLDYSHYSYFANEERDAAPGKFRVPVVANPAADWWQPHPWTSTVPLTSGGMLRLDNSDDLTGERGCPVARLTAQSTWQCVQTKSRFTGVVRQDSRGFLTEVYGAGSGLVLATSRDGGVHWRTLDLAPPKGHGDRLETPDLFNVVANGRLKQAVVSARFDDADHHGHDLVFRVDTSKARPALLKTYVVGKGDLVTANDVSGSAGYRFDYESVALLPDGRIAVTFDDSTCLQPVARDPNKKSPEVAILV